MAVVAVPAGKTKEANMRNSSKIILLLFVVTIVMLALPAHGQFTRAESGDRSPGDPGNWYAGVGVMQSSVYSCPDAYYDCYGGYTYSSKEMGFSAKLGYQVLPFLAFELAYFDHGAPTWSQSDVLLDDPGGTYDVSSTINLNSTQVSVVGMLSGEVWRVFLRGGAAFWDGKSDQVLDGDTTIERRVAEDGTALVLAIGGGVNFGERWSATLDFAFFPIADELMPLNPYSNGYAETMSLELLYRFDWGD
jgi:hypothetical protein